MKVDTVLPVDLALVADAAKRIEALGYDGALTPETGHDPFLAHAIAAEHTERIQLGTAVAIAFPRSPMATAQIAWDLQKYSNGRFHIGLGTQVKGHIVRRYGMDWHPPGPRMRDYILMMRAIWDSWQNGTRPSFEGQYYRYTLTSPFFNAAPIDHPKIPVHISAINPYNCRLVGELCDGIKLHPFNTPKYLREVILPNIEAGAKKDVGQLRMREGEEVYGKVSDSAGQPVAGAQVLIAQGGAVSQMVFAGAATKPYPWVKTVCRFCQFVCWPSSRV